MELASVEHGVPAAVTAALLRRARAPVRRLGLLTLAHMLRALVFAVERPSGGARALGVPEIGGLSL